MNISKEMKEIVICKKCGQEEYYGMMHWERGGQSCRRCIYDSWEKRSDDWRRTEDDFIFPLYKDGKDYR